MASLIVETPPAVEPVTLAEMKQYLRLEISNDDALVADLIQAAREACETFTDRSFVIKGYRQSLDSFPYFTDTMLSQMAYPPSYYSLPRWSTTLWNYSQMIKLFRPPLVAVDRITALLSSDRQRHDLISILQPWYPGTAYLLGQQVTDNQGVVSTSSVNPGNIQTVVTAGTAGQDPPTWNTNVGGFTNDKPPLVWRNDGPAPGGEFGSYIVDSDAEPGRIFPGPPGNFWPSVLYVPQAVQIHFRAGFSIDASKVPSAIKTAIKMLVANWYENREAAMPGGWQKLPHHVEMLLWTFRVMDFQPTRG